MHAADLLAHLDHLARHRLDGVRHAHRLALAGGQDAGVDGRADDVATGDDELLGQHVDVEIVGLGRAGGEGLGPQDAPLHRGGHRELDDRTEAPQEGLVDILLQVGGQHRAAFEGLHALQQEADLLVGEAVLRLLHIPARSEQRVGLVKEDHRRAAFCRVKYLLEVLLGLAHPAADHAGKVHPVHVQPQLVGDDLGRHGLAGARPAAEQRLDAEAPRPHPAAAPPVVDGLLVFEGVDEVFELALDLVGQDQVFPPVAGHHTLGQALEFRPAALAGRRI